MSKEEAVKAHGTSTEATKTKGALPHKELAKLFTRCLESSKTPDCWKSTGMVLIHMEGDHRNLKNYRLIGILSKV